jgi:Domain of unknown function (DUF4172)
MAAKPLKPWIWQRPDWPEFYWDSARLARPLANARSEGRQFGQHGPNGTPALRVRARTARRRKVWPTQVCSTSVSASSSTDTMSSRLHRATRIRMLAPSIMSANSRSLFE